LKALRALEEAVQHQQMGRYQEADRLYDRLIRKNPDYFDALNMYASFNYQQGNFVKALELLKRAVKVHPRSVNALNNLGIVLCHLKRPQEAVEAFDRALALDNANVQTLNNRGNALADLNRPEQALASFDQALTLQPNFANAYVNRGRILLQLGRLADALANYDRGLALSPLDAELHNNRGVVLKRLFRPTDALAAFERAIALRPNYPTAHYNRGETLVGLQRLEQAAAAYDTALAQKPDFADAWYGRGTIFTRRRQYDRAYAAYDKAVALQADLALAQGARLHAKMQLCGWTNLAAEIAQLSASIDNGVLAAEPFPMLALSSSPVEQLRNGERFVAKIHPAAERPVWQGERYRHDRIRIAYLSADLRQHPVAYLAAGLFEAHDRSRFETIALSFGPRIDDDMQRRLRGAFDRFLDVGTLDNREIAELLRSLEIDIAVDLNGFTENSRPEIFAQRGAPLQVSFLGFAATMGAPYIDYIVADEIVIPRAQAELYAEKIAWLPHSFLPSDASRAIAERGPTRAECNLPETAFVFACFNQPCKLNPDIFRIWMRLLTAVGGSVLWLSGLNPEAQANLRREAQACGVSPQRLIFAAHVPEMADHLARHRHADLFLDTLPYNAHTSASDALWAGLPVLTRIGETFAGRVAASLLTAVGLPEMITTTPEAYEALAFELATDRDKLAALRRKLDANRRVMPLFDTGRYTRAIEAAFSAMHARQQAGSPPDHIAIAP